MNQNKGDKLFDSKEMEQWLDNFFLDPYTTYLDETVFRIDLFDSETEFIVEALLPSIKKEHIEISVIGKELQIKVKEIKSFEPQTIQIKTRTVSFPIDISKLKMSATFEHDILEIILDKNVKQ